MTFNSRSSCSHFLWARHNHTRFLHAGDRTQGVLCGRPGVCQMNHIRRCSMVSIVVINYRGPRQSGKKSVYFSLQLSDRIPSQREGSQGRKAWTRDLKQEARRSTPHGFLSLFSPVPLPFSPPSPSPSLNPYHNAEVCYPS